MDTKQYNWCYKLWQLECEVMEIRSDVTLPNKKVTRIVFTRNNLENILKKEKNNQEHNPELKLLQEHLKNNKLSNGAINDAAVKCNELCSTISYYWKQSSMSR